MLASFAFVPGFAEALDRSPEARGARERLVDMASARALRPKTRAMIALTVAQESNLDYCLWAQTCAGGGMGLTGEDIALACAGTALDRRDAAITRLAREIARCGTFSEREVRALPEHPLLTRDEMLGVAACAGAAVIDNYILQTLAPHASSAAAPRR